MFQNGVELQQIYLKFTGTGFTYFLTTTTSLKLFFN